MQFEDVKDKIIKAINRLQLNLGEDLLLVDGFVNQSLSQSLNEIAIGARVIPMVMVIGRKTGRVYFFSFDILGIKNE